MAGLIETFDLTLYPMYSTKKTSIGDVLQILYRQKDNVFDGGLVDELIQAIGLYPAGTQVELSNGMRGVVIEQSKDRRIRATVALTHDAEDYHLLKYKVVQLGKGEYESVIIRRETLNHQLNYQDMHSINRLIRMYQRNLVSKLFIGASSMMVGHPKKSA